MNRIAERFSYLGEKKEKALVIYLTAGDPSLAVTGELILAIAEAGADILEIGVPFSDPTADGPVIQAAAQRALKTGVTLEKILEMIRSLRSLIDIPIILFGYYNPIYKYGNERFALRAAEAGVDGILVVDLPPEESAELRRYTDRDGLDFISLIAPTTDDARIGSIVRKAKGFIYYISITGVTGTAKPQPEDIRRDVGRIKKMTDIPVVAGFGISTPQQASAIAPLAEGIVIGSAVVSLIEKNSDSKDLIGIVSKYVREIKKAIS